MKKRGSFNKNLEHRSLPRLTRALVVAGLVVAAALVGHTNSRAGEPLSQILFPHLFKIDDGNFSNIAVSNLSTRLDSSVQVLYRRQNGTPAGTETATIGPLGTHVFSMDGVSNGFVGTAIVECPTLCDAAANWIFDFSDQSLKTPSGDGSGVFSVGVPGTEVDTLAQSYVSVTHDALGTFSVGLAAIELSSACDVEYFDRSGSQVGFQQFDIPARNQVAEAAQVPADFEGLVRFFCSVPVGIVTVLQNDLNKFPTVGFPTPR